MIRINLSPTAKRRGASSRTGGAVGSIVPTTDVSKGSLILVGMLAGWIGVGVIGYFMLQSVKADAAALKRKAAKIDKEAKDINAQIDEEGLQARYNRYEELKAAKEALEKKRRTPVFVFYELANILTTGEMPDVDEAEQRRREALDPQSRLDPSWEANSVWLAKLDEDDNNVLKIIGGARDPDDLSEFVKRLRASARFATVSHPEYALEEYKDKGTTSGSDKPLKPGETNFDYYTFEMTAQVAYWD
ncbi:hypothetical protein PPSIR1_35437 [Plesiocystis pacifica SIR-1]|uniref:Uncharacterized protein n=1 Tax=Plesiocystis pacifica SIR-1 TaxID=391625 RepID=A6GHB4_9BACT|nr:PilN domain-containing protein [Plesiocystis pacifica]EDM74729.1 hypothetical protein PPSIR1_35437 [Plesiocystis pacifica SIR-1]